MNRKNPAAVALGKRTSEKKAAASRANGALGGRPKKPKISAANTEISNSGHQPTP